MADLLLRLELEEFLYAEAELLDNRAYDAWLDLFTEDCHYWMPIRSTRVAGDTEHELTREWENSYFDDDKATLRQRVAKLYTAFAWSEEPPSRTRHMVTNVRIRDAAADEVTVACNFITYRTRLATDADLWIGERVDTLRRVGERWKIAARKIYLDETVLKSKNLSTFL